MGFGFGFGFGLFDPGFSRISRNLPGNFGGGGYLFVPVDRQPSLVQSFFPVEVQVGDQLVGELQEFFQSRGRLGHPGVLW